MIISKDHIFKISKKILPFSDAASSKFSLLQLLRLSLFQVSVGMATVMLAGTLNRVMIVELLVPASLVAIMIAIPVLIAPMRTFYGHKSDTYKSFIGWKRIPYMWVISFNFFLFPFRHKTIIYYNYKTIWTTP